MVETETAPATKEQLEAQYRETVGEVAGRALAFAIEDANDREMAAEILGELRERKRRGKKLFEKPKRLAKATHDELCALERRVLADTLEAEEHVEKQMRDWDAEVRRLQREAEERQARERAKAAEKAAEDLVRAQGAANAGRAATEQLAAEIEAEDPEGAQMMRDAAANAGQQVVQAAASKVVEVQTMTPTAAPAPKLAGRREHWVAVVKDKLELVKAVASGAASLDTLAVVQSELDRLAREKRTEGPLLPGVECEDKGSYVGT